MSCALSIFRLLELAPLRYDVVERLKDDPAHDSLIDRTHVVGVGLHGLETLDFEPVLGFGVSLSAMNVDRFVPFIDVEEETPAENH